MNDKIKNLEFAIQFSETNLRYLYRWEPENTVAIESNKKAIEDAQEEIKKIKENKLG